MQNYTPQRLCAKVGTGVKYDRHVKLDIADRLLNIIMAEGPVDSGPNLQDGAIVDVSLMNEMFLLTRYTINLDEWQKRPDWKERSSWHVHTKKMDTGLVQLSLVNRSAQTMQSRTPGSVFYATDPDINPILHLFVPFVDSDFSEISLRVLLLSDTSKVFSNKKFKLVPFVGDTSMAKVIPSLVITGPGEVAPDGTATLHITHVVNGEPTGRTSFVDLIAQNGYLPKTRLELRGGEADFKVTALGLDPGDQIKVKAGFFFFPSTTEFVLNVE